MAMAQIKLQKWGNSQGVRISKEVLEEIGVSESRDVSFDVEISNGRIALTPHVELTPLEQLFEGYDTSQPRVQYDWDDEPVGREYW